jgi:hypothetical protein
MPDNVPATEKKSRFQHLDYERNAEVYNEIVTHAQEIEYLLAQLPTKPANAREYEFSPLEQLENMVQQTRRLVFA